MSTVGSNEAAWHPDPSGRHEHRYWDGERWTDHVSDAGVTSTDPWTAPPPPPAQAPPPFNGTTDPADADGAGGDPQESGPSVLAAGADRLKDASRRRKEKRREKQVAAAEADATGGEDSAEDLSADAAEVAAAAEKGVLLGKGVTGRLEVDEHFVTIRRKGALAKANYGWTRGEKRIPISSITAVQYKKPGATNGYIQFSLAGGNENTKGVLAATKDENTVLFNSLHRKEFEAIRDHVEAVIVARANASAAPTQVAAAGPDLATQLRDLAALRDDGIISADEFDAQKARLLGS